MKTIVICIEKGGVGKTTIAKELSAGLAQLKGLKVLTGDMDPQGNVTKALLKQNDPLSTKVCTLVKNQFDQSKHGLLDALDLLKAYVIESKYEYDVSNVLENPTIIDKAILHTDINNLDVIPGTHNLTESDMKLKMSPQSNPCLRLSKALRQVENEYDVAVIDNPPFTNALLYNSLYASRNKRDLIIVPVSVDSGGLEGLYSTITDLLNVVEESGLDFESDFRILPVMVQRNVEDTSAVDMLRHIFPGRVFKTTIRFQGKPIKKASLNKELLVLDDKKSSVANDLRCFVNEVNELLQEVE